MLIEFSAGNFRSLRETVTLSMIATTLDSQNERLSTENVIPVSKDLSLLRSAVIYGANASGKSNVIRAFSFFRNFVLTSSRESDEEDSIRTEPFLLREDMRSEPSHFEIVFFVDKVQYRYGFETTRQKVVAEWLYHTPKSREAVLFTRENQEIQVPSHSAFREGRGLEERVRTDALFLSVAAQFNGEIANCLRKWFQNSRTLSATSDRGYIRYTMGCIENKKYEFMMSHLMQSLDFGIEELSVAETPIPSQIVQFMKRQSEEAKEEEIPTNLKQIQTQRAIRSKSGDIVRSEKFDMQKMESEGTQKLIALCGPLFDTLTEGRVLFADEIDSRLHPLMTKAILGLFNSTETNPKGAQLICATHDTNLLDGRQLRRDQIFFTEKEEDATHLYSLADFKIDGKRVRSDASYEEEYIKGRYGAIPYLGDLRRLFADEVQNAVP